ncbi:MAG: DNA internalization-related competence protein ComEC/Rec2 [Bacilli bacterium]|nr:DNA internalization-related competence protein ComEC/Rec2 [Bacilli bacterium]
MKGYLQRLKIILLQNRFLILFLLITIIYCSLFILLFNPKELNDTSITGYIYDYKIDGNKLTLKIKSRKRVVVNYYFKTEKEKNSYNLEYGDHIKLKGEYTSISENTNFNMFNYKKYLYSKKIYYQFNASNIKLIKRNNNILFTIKNLMVKRIEKYHSKKYLYVFLLSNKNFLEDNLYSSYKNLGLVHLICISGMHITYIIMLLNKLKIKKIFIYIFLLLYMFLLNFSISIVRCFLMFLLKNIKTKYKLDISNEKLLLIIMLILLIINPFYIYNIAFIFSFVISFGLYYSKTKYTSLVAFFYSIPILINNYFKINFISLIMNIIFIPIISYIIFPFSCLVFIFNFLDEYFYYITNFIDKIMLKMNEISIFTLSFSKLNILFIIIYYLILFLAIKNRKFIVGIIILIPVFYLNNMYVITPRVYFLDVGQGDSSLIRINNKNYLIDTGGKYSYSEDWKRKNHEYSLSNDLIIPFSRSVGVKKIDYLILTHGDYDHMWEAINLVNNFKVEKVIFNCGEFNDLEQELIKVLNKKKIPYYSCIKELNIDNNKLYFLQTKEYDNENDNSNVIYTEINGYKFMFMGDAGKEKEKDILDKYNISDIDVLKVGHHGSKTSSSESFINEMNPRYSVISVGKNNRYGHPNKEVLNNLDNSIIYRTDRDGSIMFKIKNNKLKIETCSP